MKKPLRIAPALISTQMLLLFSMSASAQFAPPAVAPRQMENLGRGVVAIYQGDGKAFVSWRMLGTDPEAIAFNIYRETGDAAPVKLNAAPIIKCTSFQDTGLDISKDNSYEIRPLIGAKELEPSKPFLNTIKANAEAKPYINIPLKEGLQPSDASVGDLDGDGEYEIVIKRDENGRDNSQAGVTGEVHLEAYKMDGTFLWKINLGKNIRAGAHYTQFMVYDLDGDGKAEVVCKTADGTVDGTGTVIGDANADYRDNRGYVLSGPEFLTVFDGLTGKALATTNYIPPRGKVADWGDPYGNRVDRFNACIAYLDGVHPSVVMCRGYYTRTVLAAWDWRGGKLTSRWVFDSDKFGAPNDTNPYRGQGNHGLSVADIKGDGKDAIIFGAMCVGSDGKPVYSTKLHHGDAMHVSDMDPTHPGLEIFDIHEHVNGRPGVDFRDAKTGKVLWSKNAVDIGRGSAFDIDPRYLGYEMWYVGQGAEPGLLDVHGKVIAPKHPKSVNFGVWWDGDFLRELLDGNHIDKWDWLKNEDTRILTAEECVSNNGTKSTPCLSGDIFGDWREEVIWRTADNTALHIYTTTIPTNNRLYTLMHDPQYRLAIAWQNSAYNQPPHPGFYLGNGMKLPPPKPNIVTIPAKK
jgi:rhamnogalacturonan endolyase